jgi:hypothetical protein
VLDVLSRAVAALRQQLTPEFNRDAAGKAGLAVKHWQAYRAGDGVAIREFAFACAQLGVEAVVAEALVLHAFMAGRAAGSHVAGYLKPNEYRLRANPAKPAAKHKTAALKAFDEERARGLGIMAARNAVSKALKLTHKDAPSPSSIRDWVKQRAAVANK